MKKLLVKILVLVMAVSLCGCGEEQKAANEIPVLSSSTMELELGKTGEIKVLNYTGEVSWSTSDEKVVTVSPEGLVTPVALGSAAVTAYINNGENMSCAVTVLPGSSKVESISVTSLYSDASDVTLNYNDSPTAFLKATCTPMDMNERLTWSSSDDRLAQVNQSGVVTAYANGRVEIIVTALNGVSGRCILRIKNVPASVAAEAPRVTAEAPRVAASHSSSVTSPVPVTSETAQSTIIVSDKSIGLEIGEGFKLTCAVGNPPANNTVEWMSSDKSVAVVKNGTVVGVGNGTCVVSAVTSDGAAASCTVAVGKDAIKELKEKNSDN